MDPVGKLLGIVGDWIFFAGVVFVILDLVFGDGNSSHHVTGNGLMGRYGD